jgi:hypothetical protein
MKVPPSKTLNPLHFEDLEPHRFEDLCRQLVYDLRDWTSIEALGRSGSDGGIDIRAIETEPASKDGSDGEQANDDASSLQKQRIWVIQCKRVKSITPKNVSEIVNDFFAQPHNEIYGYMLIGACDFSKAARDKFREEMTTQKIADFKMVGKAELEDMLFLPKNDHLLFAYFGISLQVARRTLKTSVTASLATKRKLCTKFDAINGAGYTLVLVRDPRNTEYPRIQDIDLFLKHPQWMYFEVARQIRVDHVAFIVRKCFAYANFETKEWDALQNYNDCSGPSQLSQFMHGSDERADLRAKYFSYWNDKIPEGNRAWVRCIREISYSRIMAVDEFGDRYNNAPHLLVEYRPGGDPFEEGGHIFVEHVGNPQTGFCARKENKRKYFPDIIPDPMPFKIDE